MTAIEGIFFDLDGTLLDTAKDFIVTINRMLKEANLPPMEANLIKSLISAGSRAIIQEAFQLKPGVELEHKTACFFEEYNRQIHNIKRKSVPKIYPGALPLLKELHKHGIAWGIITNKPRNYAKELLKQTDLLKCTQVLVCPEDVQFPKPDPQSLLLACSRTNCKPSRSIYIGDHSRDIQAGKRAGMMTVAAHYGYILNNDNPFEWLADLDINTLDELHKKLRQMNWAIPTSFSERISL